MVVQCPVNALYNCFAVSNIPFFSGFGIITESTFVRTSSLSFQEHDLSGTKINMPVDIGRTFSQHRFPVQTGIVKHHRFWDVQAAGFFPRVPVLLTVVLQDLTEQGFSLAYNKIINKSRKIVKGIFSDLRPTENQFGTGFFFNLTGQKNRSFHVPGKHRKPHKIGVSVTDIPDDGLVPGPGQRCFGQKIDLPAGNILGCLFETGPGQGDISRVQSQVEPGDGQLDQQGFHDA